MPPFTWRCACGADNWNSRRRCRQCKALPNPYAKPWEDGGESTNDGGGGKRPKGGESNSRKMRQSNLWQAFTGSFGPSGGAERGR
eukprot:15444734-Alexandrium_andersonii.AAC.1